MKLRITFFLLFVIFPLSILIQPASLIQDEKVASNIHILESWIRAQMDYHNLPGISVGIIYDQELIYAKGFGYSNLEDKTPATAQTLYRIASISKTFTATAIMQLRDEGKLRLDDPIEKFLPGFNIKNPFSDTREITVFQLITHTSGLPRNAGFPYWTDRKFPTMKQILEALPEQEMIYPPGTQYKYSNLGIALLGEIVSVASGMSYEKYITENILKPLDMTSSSVFLTERDKEKLTVPYSYRFPDGSRRIMPFTDAKGIAPAANITSNIEDMSKYISLQFQKGRKGGNQILDSYTLEDMQRVQWLNTNWTSGYGLGFRVWKQNNYTMVGHGGWVAGNRSQISFIPKEKIGIVVLTNADDASPAFFARKILELMMPVIKSAVTPQNPVEKADPFWKKFVGIYTDPSWFDTELMIYNNQLVMNSYSIPPEDTPDSEIKVLTPVGANTFRMSGPNGNGELVVFEMDSNNKVVRIKVGENYIFPKK